MRPDDPHRHADQPRCLRLEGVAPAAPIDEQRPDQRRHQRQDQRDRQSKQRRLHPMCSAPESLQPVASIAGNRYEPLASTTCGACRLERRRKIRRHKTSDTRQRAPSHCERRTRALRNRGSRTACKSGKSTGVSGPLYVGPAPSPKRNDLAWVHDVVRVERLLDRPHRGERRLAVLGRRYFILPWPTPCSPVQVPSMARARSTSRSQKRLGARDLVGVVQVDQQREVEVAVADMAEDRREQAGSPRCPLASRHAFGEPRDRHAHVGGDRLRAGPQPARRPVGVMAGLPQPGAVLGPGRPFERAAADGRAAIAPNCADCSATAAALPWNSRNSVGGSGRPSFE